MTARLRPFAVEIPLRQNMGSSSRRIGVESGDGYSNVRVALASSSIGPVHKSVVAHIAPPPPSRCQPALLTAVLAFVPSDSTVGRAAPPSPHASLPPSKLVFLAPARQPAPPSSPPPRPRSCPAAAQSALPPCCHPLYYVVYMFGKRSRKLQRRRRRESAAASRGNECGSCSTVL